MRRLRRPRRAYKRDLLAILTEADISANPKLVARACGVARAYASRAPNVESGVHSVVSASEKEALLKAYDSDRKSMQSLRNEIAQLLDETTKATCQYCGISDPVTLDHVLSKSEVPDLALYARNLVPSCRDCNTSRRLTDQLGRRQILHFYDDDIGSMPEVLRVDLVKHPEGFAARYEVDPHAHPCAVVYSRHFQALDLASRYTRKAGAVLREWRIRLLGRSVSDHALKREAGFEAASKTATYGVNDPHAALFRAIVASRPTRDWLRS